ncbi:MAG: hypothetical protein O2855_09075 [Planctomycetota bacterium]|nr:hypothetical protein [Planctomycetota bacterium]
MASQSIKEVFGGQAPKYPPVSAFGWYMCCCGGVWSTIVEMQLVGSINKVSGAPAIPVFAVFVPIWQILISYELIKNMNKVISDRSLSVPPLEANHLFIWLLYPVALYQMINHWNAIVDAE